MIFRISSRTLCKLLKRSTLCRREYHWLSQHHKKCLCLLDKGIFIGAGDEARTRYLHLGKVALYRMSYTRRNMMYYNSFSEKVKPFFRFFLIFFAGEVSLPLQ